MTLNTLKTARSAHTSRLNFAVKEIQSYPPDVTFCARDGKLEVNRLLLSLYSPTLNSVISDWVPSTSILLPDFSIVSVRILIELLVSGSSSYQDIQEIQDIPIEDFGNVFEIAKLLKIQLNANNVQAIDSEEENEKAKNTNTSKTKEVDNTSLQNDDLEHELGESSISEVTCKEKFSGSTAKKYKQSLRVSGKPIDNFLNSDGTRPPSHSIPRRQAANVKQQMNTARPLQPSNLVKSEKAEKNKLKGSTKEIRKGKENNIPDKGYRKDVTNPLKVSFTPLEGNIKDIGECSAANSAKKDRTTNSEETTTYAAKKDRTANDEDTITNNAVVKDSAATFEQNQTLSKNNFQTKYFSMSNTITKGTLKQDGEKSIFEVSCKECKAEFHQDKFISGGQGLCILFEESWMTPNAFEKVAGSKARKYKESLKVNGKPIKHLIDPEGNRPATPSVTPRQSSNLNKRNHQTSTDPEGDRPATPSVTPRQSSNLNKRIPQTSTDPEGNRPATPSITPRQSSNLNKRNPQTSSKIEIDKDKLLNKTSDFVSDDEIDLSGTPVFMDCTVNANDRSYSVIMDESSTENTTIDESFANPDESYTDNAVLIDLDSYLTPLAAKKKRRNDEEFSEVMGAEHVVKEKKSKKKNIDVSQSNDTKADENYQKPATKQIKSRFSADQTSGLRKAFNENNFISKEKARILSQELCLTETQVKTWFQNSRTSKMRTGIVPDESGEKMDVQDEMGHKSEQSSQEYPRLEKVSGVKKQVNQKYNCELCSKSFIYKSKLVQHMSSHDSGSFDKKDDTDIEDEKQCRCECGAIYKNPLLLKFHKNQDCVRRPTT